MCGRYSIALIVPELADWFDARTELPEEWQKRYNVAPTQLAPVVYIDREGGRALRMMRWGLIPFWSKDAKNAFKTINARSETVAEKPSFREAFQSRRCIVPADGFFEWRKDSEKQKTPLRIFDPAHRILGLAGLWEKWRSPETGEEIQSYTILTTEPNASVSSIHDRMPLILRRENYGRWLKAGPLEAAEAKELLAPRQDLVLSSFPVSRLVNSPKNDVPECLAPEPSQGAPASC